MFLVFFESAVMSSWVGDVEAFSERRELVRGAPLSGLLPPALLKLSRLPYALRGWSLRVSALRLL